VSNPLHGLFGRRGRAGSLALALLLAAAGLVLAFVLFGGAWRGETPRAEHENPSRSPATDAEAPGAGAPVDPDPYAAQNARSAAAGAAPAPGLDVRFRGRGEIRGRVEVSGDGPFPTTWQLVLRPSTSLVGRELAEERVLEFVNGEQDFAVRDLPLAGYDVLPQAAGMNGLTQPVLLDTRNTSPFVSLRLVPAGVLEGKVLDAERLPAAGVTLTLVPKPPRVESEPLVTTTDALGIYRFGQVLDGPYELVAGTPDFPLGPPPQRLVFKAPSLTMPDIVLPPLAVLDLIVVDELENRVENAAVAGSSPSGGTLAGTTDAAGRLVVPHLLPGRWRIELEHEGHKSRRVTADLVAGETAALNLQLFP
jgi:hypothetical protein